jgi:hypothetical protein
VEDHFAVAPLLPGKASRSADAQEPNVEKGETSVASPLPPASGNEAEAAKPKEAEPDVSAQPEPAPPLPDQTQTDPAVIEPTPTPTPMPMPMPTPTPVPVPSNPTLDVKLPSAFVRAGGPAALAISGTLTHTEGGKVRWSLDPSIGTIDDNGIYHPPERINTETTIKVVGKWDKDSNVSGSASLTIVPNSQNFVNCSESVVFPIKADIYRIPKGSNSLPDINTLTDRFASLCMDSFDISEQVWTGESPNLPNLKEWFLLHAESELQIPKEGTYRMRLFSDDGSRLYIDDKLVIDFDGIHSASNKDGSVTLTEGRHKIVVDWYQQEAGKLALQLLWRVPGSDDFRIIPMTSFAR